MTSDLEIYSDRGILGETPFLSSSSKVLYDFRSPRMINGDVIEQLPLVLVSPEEIGSSFDELLSYGSTSVRSVQ